MEFGAFVNIGAATDGLLHISQISVGGRADATGEGGRAVLAPDPPRPTSLASLPAAPAPALASARSPHACLLTLPPPQNKLPQSGFVKKVSDAVKVGDEVKVRVASIDAGKGKFAGERGRGRRV